MGMEISAHYLQQADERTQPNRNSSLQGQEADATERERFDQAMRGQPDNKGQQAEEALRQEGQGGTAPSPASLMESLFGQRMPMDAGSASVGASTPVSHTAELVDKLVDRILVSEPGKGNPEVLLRLGDGVLAGAELRLGRGVDGLLSVQLLCPDANSFQTAVGAQDSLRSALERTGDQVRVEVSHGGAEGGNEGDARRRSATYMEETDTSKMR
ncbi:MAG: hypothetical protein IJA79_03375 [Desulfovibrio sp.]|nr:hypothetical protein [Desulfovibrio sp.]